VPPPMTAPADPDGDRSLRRALIGLFVAAVSVRALLTRVYWGSEEEDYGNLGLIMGTLQSGFRYIETEHMPLFTTLAAAATALTGDAEAGGEWISILAGSLLVVSTAWVGWRWLSPAAGLLAGALLVLQPDAALYSATPLRITTYASLAMGGIALFGGGRFVAAGVALSLAFLTRFDAAFTLLPAVALGAGFITVTGRPEARRAWIPAAMLLATAIAWAAYYQTEFDTWRFWGDVQNRQGSDPSLGRVARYFAYILPAHIGWIACPAALFGVLAVVAGRARDGLRARWLLLCGAATFGFLLLAVFLSGYRYDHNLFWKWMTASVPLLLLAGAHGAVEGGRRFGPRGAVLAAGLLVVTSLVGYGFEYRSQLQRSDVWYGTQVRLTAWLEQQHGEDRAFVADLIPATWQSRRPTTREVFRWSDDRIPDGGAEAFGEFLQQHDVAVVIWFREEWIDCHRFDDLLAAGTPTTAGPVKLLPIAREDEYGFIAYAVTDDLSATVPQALPPVDAGGIRYLVQEP